MSDIVLPVYIREFHGPREVKFIKNKIPEGFGTVLEEFCEEIPKVDYFGKFSEIIAGIDTTGAKWKKRVVLDGVEMDMKRCLEKLMESWLRNFLGKIDLEMVRQVNEAVQKTSRERIKKEDQVYNFTDKTIDPKIIRTLGYGGNFVQPKKIDNIEAKNKIESELLDYLRRYRKYIKKSGEIQEVDLKNWLQEATTSQEVSDPHIKFYMLVEENLENISVPRSKNKEDYMNDFKKLDRIGVCVVDCDKKMGIALINIEDVVKADLNLIKELGGIKVESQNDKSVMEEINRTIQNFETSLSAEAMKYLRTYYPYRYSNSGETEIPFMKVACKVHKLSAKELKERKPGLLKYRPVIDSSRTPYYSYSKALMHHAKDLTNRLTSKYFTEDSPFVSNGHGIAQYLLSHKFVNCPGTVFAVADLSSAYSYIYLDNLLFAMNFAVRDLRIPEWKSELFATMAKLVLNNSYVKSSGGVFKLSNSLPMGLSCSGECLDLVCLVFELSFRGKILFPEFSPCSELQTVWSIVDEKKISSRIKKYFRYRDDTFSVISASCKEDASGAVHAIGSAFLSTLDINVNLSHFVGSFLDCYFFKSITGDKFHTLVRRKANCPITFQHSESNQGFRIINSIVKGEVLRHRRLCSSEEFSQMNDKCLKMELASRGYQARKIDGMIKQRINSIRHGYSKRFIKLIPSIVPSGIVYGSKTIHDSDRETHLIVNRLLSRCLQVEVRLASVVSPRKLKNSYYTKKRYLKMSSKYLRNKI